MDEEESTERTREWKRRTCTALDRKEEKTLTEEEGKAAEVNEEEVRARRGPR